MRQIVTRLAVALPALFSLPLLAQVTSTYTVTQTYAAAVFNMANGEIGTATAVRSVPPSCDLTCTVISYSFCANETPGCLEGYAEVPNSAFKGSVGSNYEAANTLTVNVNAVTNPPYVLNWSCGAFEDNNCINQTTEPGGEIQVTFTKTPLYEDVNTSTGTVLEGGVFNSTTEYDELFSDESEGTIVGTSFTVANDYVGNVGASCCMAFQATFTRTWDECSAASVKRPSELLEGRLPEKVVRRLRAIEDKLRVESRR
jgi:hypothetical protein